MTVAAKASGGSCTVRVSQSGSILTKHSPTEIARLNVTPLTEATALFGVQDNAWGLLHVGTDGIVTIYHIYGSESLTWDAIDTSVSFTI